MLRWFQDTFRPRKLSECPRNYWSAVIRYIAIGRMGSPVPYRHEQNGQSGATSPWAGWAVRYHIAMSRMVSSVPYHHGQDGQSGVISVGSPVPYRHGQDGQSDAISIYAMQYACFMQSMQYACFM